MQELLLALLSAGCMTALVMFFRLCAYGFHLFAQARYQRRMLTADPETRKLLLPPPEVPEALKKIMVLAVVLGAMTAMAAVLRHQQQAGPEAQRKKLDLAAPILPAAPAQVQTLPAPAPAMLAEYCDEKVKCGTGCACKSNSCRCLSNEKKGPVPRKPDRKKSGGGKEPGEVPHSGIAARPSEPMAGAVDITLYL